MNAARRRYIRELEILGQGNGADFILEIRMRAQRLQFRTEDQRASRPTPIKRLFSDPVAREGEALFQAIPDREREHPG